MTLVALTFLASTALSEPPAPVPLPLDAAVLVKKLEGAVAAQNGAEVERITRVLVVLGPRAKKVLAREVARKDSPILPQVLGAIGRMAPELRVIARPLLGSNDARVRAMAVEAIDGADTRLLAGALARESDPAVRLSIVSSMGNGDDAQATAALCESLASPDAKMRVKALEGLLVRHDKRALPEVHGALRDPSAAVRRAAVRVVASLHHRSSVGPLIGLASLETSKKTLDLLFSALEDITGQHFGKDLDAWKRWLDTDT